MMATTAASHSSLEGEILSVSQAQVLAESWLAYLDNAALASGAMWSPPVLFYPDGTATDAKAIILDKNQQAIQLWVRGLTGAVVQSPRSTLLEIVNGKQ